ncbi:uncharacterized protein LOC126772584 [Nymphalis io]|uniref:uncharacterized protein LOC126772584 n=1 Tax=Inachis io TaxID=171585 RepID=UPI002169D779|nr:uncharacterized protein LOC126772584 [Nymphalis io]
MSLQDFRRQTEEIRLEKPPKIENDESSQNLVTFLVNNVKQIFTDAEEPIILLEPDLNTESKNTIEISTTDIKSTTALDETVSIPTKQNMSEMMTVDESNTSKANVKVITVEVSKNDTKVENLLAKGYDSFHKTYIQDSKHEMKKKQPFNSTVIKMSFTENEINLSKRSCISCNNIVSMGCSEPKNKLIPSVICKNNEDMCYSQHTPFGIVNRGCFNIHRNLTTYVCSCNLCNYISISEMPHIFSMKRDWIENVIELSRTKSFRSSIFKDMSCLRCEVNATLTTDLIYKTNCLEGHISSLPIQECGENEICGIKAIRSEGYIWRGCLASPLYNHWWMFCDSDLCNHDSLVSIFEESL